MTEEVSNSDFSDKKELLINWLATPKSKRKPKVQKDLADILGVSEDTVCLWKRDPALLEAIRTKIQENSCFEDDADVIAALVKSAKNPTNYGAADRKTYLQWRGLLVEKQEVKQENSGSTIVTVNYIDPISKPAQ